MALKHKHNSGLTLLEVMVATGVLVVAISGLMASFAHLASLNENSRKLTLAITASLDKMEEIRNSDFSNLYAAYNASNFEPNGFDAAGIDAEGAISIDNSDPALLEVCVSVSWRERSNRIIGEDLNLNGAFDAGEDSNGDNRLSSPAEIVTLIGQR